MSKIKYCKATRSRNWYVFGFQFAPVKYKYRAGIVCYDANKVWTKKMNMYIVEADAAVKDMLFSDDKKNNILATTILDSELKKKKQVIDYFTGEITV